MKDLEIAKKRLHSENLALSVVKDSEVIFESKNRGISGFLQALEKFGDRLKGASVADKVVGKAIALLCVYAGIKAVYASTLSKEAKTVFERHKIPFEWDMLVEKILDANKVEACPFEKAAINISDPEEAYIKFKDLQRTLQRREG
ncbi:MAG: DUF1893 domain-containing protein [Candidatus Bathyarchaeales archaeon]